MFKKVYVLLAVFLIAGMVLASCQPAKETEAVKPTATEAEAQPPPPTEEPKPTDTAPAPEKKYLTISNQLQATWVRNFNPFSPSNLAPTTNAVYEPLMIYNNVTGELTPWLATEYKWSEDNLTLTLTLRKGVLWSDGEAFTSADVITTFDLLKKPELVGTASSVLNEYVESYTAVDDFTVEFKFKTVYTLAIYDLVAQLIMPKHIWADVEAPDTWTNDNPVGTGPFTEVAKFENQIYIMERNPNYWLKDEIKFDGLRFPAWPGNDQANLALVNGEVDYAGNFVPDIEKTFVAKDPENFHYYFAQGGMILLYLNPAVKPFDNPEVRKALSYALDRNMIVENAMFNYTIPGDITGLSDQYKPWKDPEVQASADWNTYDVAKANELLDGLGLTKGADGIRQFEGNPMKYRMIVVSGWTDWVQACQIMAQNLQDVGLDVTVQTPEYNAWYDELSKGEHEMAIGWSSGGPTPYNFYRGQLSKLSFLPVGESSGENWNRIVNEEADKLLEQFAQTADMDEQKAIMKQVEQIFVDTAPALPLFPGPEWYEYVTLRFDGFVTEENPYSPAPPWLANMLVVYTHLTPK